MSTADRLGAFVPGTDCRVAGAGTGPLEGLTFAAKDLFDVAGHVTGCGNPDWAASHPPAGRHADAVARLLAAGADLVGKTVTDEISLGLLGRNAFHGTPRNSAAPDRLPGGSSSGSAAAVAGNLCDTALGTDSGGSVRVPASFCGLYGLRPTHGRIPVAGLMTQSPSFDTVGWFARDPVTFARVGAVLLGEAPAAADVEILLAEDALASCAPEVAAAAGPVLREIAGGRITLAGDALPQWFDNQRRLQMFEFGRTFAPWVERCAPRFSIEVGRSLTLASLLTEEEVAPARRFRVEATARLEALLGRDRVVCLPTTPILPPRRDPAFSTITGSVERLVRLTCIAGLTGLPQASLPLASHAGIPVGISLIGWRGGDAALLALAQALAAR